MQPRTFVVTTDSDHDFEVYLNLASRMKLTGVNQLWVADITYIRLHREWVFLAVILEALVQTPADKKFGWAPLGGVNCDGVKQRVPRSTTPTSSPFARPACPSCIVLS